MYNVFPNSESKDEDKDKKQKEKTGLTASKGNKVGKVGGSRYSHDLESS